MFQVVMAVYNGQEYISKQIESILAQIGNSEILIHDDGSSDRTPEIITEWSKKDKRIKLVAGPPQGGASKNFSFLLGHTQAEYVFCVDQDDIWTPDRAKNLLDLMHFYEKVYDDSIPLLIHSDLKLINSKDKTIVDSMWKYQNLDPNWGRYFNLILTQNTVTGCTMLANRALLRISLPIPESITMHDHWLALVACEHGKIVWTYEPSVLYRQHNSNEVGAKRYSKLLILDYIKSVKSEEGKKNNIEEEKLYNTALEYYNRFPNSLYSRQLRIFASLGKKRAFTRTLTIILNKFYMNGLLRNLGWIIKPKRYINDLQMMIKYFITSIKGLR